MGISGRRLDPAKAIAYVERHYGVETDPSRRHDGPLGWSTEMICNFFMQNPKGGIKRKLSEIGNADVPPMFKSFLRVETIGSHALEISCYGVTGWAAHDGTEPDRAVPREDCVRIEFGPPEPPSRA